MSTAQNTLQANALQKIALFADLPHGVLQKLAAELEEIQASKDQMIIRKGDTGDSIYIVIRGAVVVHDEDRILATLIAGEYFGEYALIDQYTRSASVTAIQPSSILKLTRDRFQTIMDQYPALNDVVLKELTKRLRTLSGMQDQLLKNNKEINEQKKEIERINADLQEINEEKSHILRVLAHELKNTLTSTISISEILQEEISEKAPDLLEYQQRLTKSLWRMNDRIDRILATKSKIPQKKELEITEFDLQELMDDLKKQFEEQARNKGIKFKIKKAPYRVLLDRGYTRQIFENLIGNALRFSSEGKSVVVRTKEQENHVVISVSDQGPGLSEAALKPLTEDLPAEEVEVRNPSDLSLAIVRQYTESMGGKITCDTQPGKGAKFSLHFKDYQKQSSTKGFWERFQG